MSRARVATAILAAIGGCAADSAADLGRPPPVRFVAATREVPFRLGRDGGLTALDTTRLAHAIQELGGDPQSVRARVEGIGTTSATVAAVLVGLRLDPDRITAAPAAGPPRVLLSRLEVVTQPCQDALPANRLADASAALLSVASCDAANNLAEMLVDPMDLVSPLHGTPSDGANAAQSIKAWRAARSAGAGTPGRPAAPPARDTATTTPLAAQ